MGTKNTRNAALLLSATLGGTYTKVNKTHAMNMSLSTDFSEDTSHGDSYKSYIPGLQDFQVSLEQWYETATTMLEYASLHKISYYFIMYPDYLDTVNYYRGQCYFGLDGFDLGIGNTANQSYTMTAANGDVQLVRAGAAL